MTNGIDDQAVFSRFPNINITRDNVEHYRGMLNKQLLINRCQDCGYWIYPHRPLCPECWSWDVKPTEVSGTGSIYMFTLIQQPRVAEGDLFVDPLPLVAVELSEQEGLRYLSSVVDTEPDQLKVGSPVVLCWIENNSVPQVRFRLADAG